MAPTIKPVPDTKLTAQKPLPTPVHITRLLHYLEGFPQDHKQYLYNGFTEGFRLGFEGNNHEYTAKNSRTTALHPDAVTDKITKELSEGRISGPYSTPPFEHFRSSPLGVRPKKEDNKWRILHNLSYPYDTDSVNHAIPKELKTVSYATIDDATQLIAHIGNGTWLAKSDFRSAFKLIPIHPSDYHLLGFSWQGFYYYDMTLPMGAGSSCQIFEKFSSCIDWILRNKFQVTVLHYLDDFLFLAPDQKTCTQYLQTFLTLCDDLGVPIAHK